MTLSDQLRAVRETLLTRGWISGETSRRGQVCLGGAINLVVRGEVRRWPMRPNRVVTPCTVIQYLSAIAGVADAGTGYGLAAWNDAPGRTPEDILGLVDRALERSLATCVESPGIPACRAATAARSRPVHM